MFENFDADLFGIYLPDTAANRLKIETGLEEGPGTTHQAMVQYLKNRLQENRVGGKAAPAYVSANYIDPLHRYLNREESENRVLRRYWSNYFTSLAPAPLNVPPSAIKSIDIYFEAMASHLAPWTRGQLPDASGGIAKLLSPLERRTMAQAKDEFRQAVAGYHAAWRPYENGAKALSESHDQSPKEIARRKFLSILARPGLAKFLGFIIDVEVKTDEFERALGKDGLGLDPNSNAFFLLLADFGEADTAEETGKGSIDDIAARVWTGALIERVAQEGGVRPRFFGPAQTGSFFAALGKGLRSPGISSVSASPYDRGVLDLAAGGNDGKQRFAIVDFDPDAALNALENAGQDRSTALQKGGLEENVPTAMPDLRTRGLALIDRDRKSDVAKENEGTASRDPTKPQVLYAEDLVIGYRLNVGLCRKDEPKLPAANRWRSLHNRIVEYDSSDIGGTYMTWLKADAAREDGFAKPVTRVATVQDSTLTNKPQYIAQETLAAWTGTSLAVATERQADKTGDAEIFVTEVTRYSELGTNTHVLASDRHSAPTAAAEVRSPLLDGRAPGLCQWGECRARYRRQ